jgi:steroid delta-isomerase-like uncharacterized protein
MPSKNVETLRAAHDSWNRRDFDAMVGAMAPNVSYTDHARGITFKTRDEFRNWAAGWAQAFSDGRITQPSYIDAGNTVVAQFTASGTNDGPLGPYPATGRRMTLRFCEIWQFDANGQTTSGGAYYDQYTLLTQLGHVKQPASAAGI